MKLKRILLTCLISFTLTGVNAQNPLNRWFLSDGNAISWKPGTRIPHDDHIEMSGRYISAVIRYGVRADGSFQIQRDVVWPMLRTIPNNTHASLTRSFSLDPVSLIAVNKRLVLREKVNEIRLDGTITVKSTVDENLELIRILFPSTDRPEFGEKYVLTNTGKHPVTIEIPEINILSKTNPDEGVDGTYTIQVKSYNSGTSVLQPNTSVTFCLRFSATKKGQDYSTADIEKELQKRRDLVAGFAGNLILDTPDEVLNRAFAFAKIRAAESIYQTKGGPMHGPGGLSYYAAIWANDQAEYINPFFPFLGYDYGVESAINAYRHFARFMNPEYKPIPSSIVAEGTDIWNGAGDRGDAAMIAYGASRFALTQGHPESGRRTMATD